MSSRARKIAKQMPDFRVCVLLDERRKEEDETVINTFLLAYFREEVSAHLFIAGAEAILGMVDLDDVHFSLRMKKVSV